MLNMSRRKAEEMSDGKLGRKSSLRPDYKQIYKSESCKELAYKENGSSRARILN